MSGDLLSQIAQGGEINIFSLMASATFSNSFTSAFMSNAINHDGSNNSLENIITRGILGGIAGRYSNKVSAKYDFSSFSNNEKIATVLSLSIINFWGNYSSAEMQKVIKMEPVELEKKEIE